MADNEPKSLMGRLHANARHAVLAGALATGSSSPAPMPVPTVRMESTMPLPQRNTPPPAPADALPAEYSRYIKLGADRLRIALVMGQEVLPILITGADAKGVAQRNLDRSVARALAHPERYANVGLRISDANGELPICVANLAIPVAERTREGLSQRLAMLMDKATVVEAAMRCSIELPSSDNDPRWSDPLPGESEPLPPAPIDPRTIVRQDATDDARQLAGRLVQNGPQRHV